VTSGFACDPLTGKKRWATPLDPIPYVGGGLSDETVGPDRRRVHAQRVAAGRGEALSR
jgi:hypothetical protein